MANANNLHGANPPGPRPKFDHRMDLRLRSDQVQTLTRIARVIGVSVSDLVRWFIDEGVRAVEAAPTYDVLKEKTNAE